MLFSDLNNTHDFKDRDILNSLNSPVKFQFSLLITSSLIILAASKISLKNSLLFLRSSIAFCFALLEQIISASLRAGALINAVPGTFSVLSCYMYLLQ